jgi:hypothetical protein
LLVRAQNSQISAMDQRQQAQCRGRVMMLKPLANGIRPGARAAHRNQGRENRQHQGGTAPAGRQEAEIAWGEPEIT